MKGWFWPQRWTIILIGIIWLSTVIAIVATVTA